VIKENFIDGSRDVEIVSRKFDYGRRRVGEFGL